jgi:hypothetical protein
MPSGVLPGRALSAEEAAWGVGGEADRGGDAAVDGENDLLMDADTPDALSDWTLPPPAAREAGDVAPIRVFDTAEAALLFLAGQDRRAPRALMAESRERLPV